MEKKLELRMYFFVIYQLSGIQKSIQAGHSAMEYARKYRDDPQFIDFADNWKTWIILNGGTSNSDRGIDGIPFGSIDGLSDKLLANDIKYTYFREPDLNDAMTALCFIVDERVFNKKDYPDFKDYLIANVCLEDSSSFLRIKNTDLEELKVQYKAKHLDWINLIGGEKNEFLRELLKDKKLA